MRVIKPKVEIDVLDGYRIIRNIEKAGRTCYRSESRMTTESAGPFIKSVIKRGHFSVLEHEKVTARITCDRGVSHEIVRHRIGSYSQESTRYVKYKEGIEVIEPIFWDKIDPEDRRWIYWEKAMKCCEDAYKSLIDFGAKPEEARSVLPNSLATEIVVTYNLREWRHFFWLRGSIGAHIQIREIAIMLLDEMKNAIPVVFDDFKIDRDNLIITTDLLPAS